MIRPMLRRLAPLVLLGLFTCQDYRFNPVGRCTIQPGQTRVSISGISTADILFVIDDSASMAPIQASLANNFQSFIQQVAAIQAAEVAAGRPALDLYVAITSSAVRVNRGLAGVNCSGGTCSITNPTFPPPYSYACSVSGSTCADIIDKFYAVGACSVTTTRACATTLDCPGGETCNNSGCTALGLAPARGSPFFAGSFVARGTNPKVLAFTKGLNWSAWQTDPTIQGLIARFGENIQVGDCGANQEMHFEAGRKAVEKAEALQQGLPAGVTWPHPESKLVVVFVGNEDDCSTRRADEGGLVWTGPSGSDSCENQAQLAPGDSLQYPVAEYVSFFTRYQPLGAAFIGPGDASLLCNCTGLPCNSNGFGKGTRFKALASAFKEKGVEVVEASVCGNFGQALADIAKIVKPLSPLTLPTQPAAGVVTQLRLVGSDGKTAYVCSGPSTSGDWWFVDCDSQVAMLGGATSLCVGLGACSVTTTKACTIDAGCPSGETCLLRNCHPAAGQTLVAEYLGRLPKEGCSVGTAGAPSTECATLLGGNASAWSCDATGGQVGTCLCRTGQ